MKQNVTRRDFIRASTALGAALSFPTIIPSSALGKGGAVAPSNRVRVAAIGCGDKSVAVRAYEGYAKSDVVAVCDPVRSRAEQRAHEWGIAEKDIYADFRELLTRDDIDAVHIATGDYWHVPISLAAARAGKDMYTEKPLGLTIEEALAARQIEDRYGRIFQYGTQQRSLIHTQLAMEVILDGHIGEVQEIYASAIPGISGGSCKPGVLPVGWDLDLWTGPAPMHPFCEGRHAPAKQTAKGIHHHYDYSIGFISGCGSHPLDTVQWYLDEMKIGMPVEVKGTGTIPSSGLFNTITNWDTEITYPNGTKLYFMDKETKKSPARNFPKIDAVRRFGNFMSMYMGTEGWIAIDRGAFAFSSDDLRRKARQLAGKRLPESRQHGHNFIDGVLARQNPVSNLQSAVRSDITNHMCDIAIRTGETLGWDQVKERVIGSSNALGMMRRDRRAPWTQL